MDAARLFGRLADEQVDMVLVGGMAAIAHHVVHPLLHPCSCIQQSVCYRNAPVGSERR